MGAAHSFACAAVLTSLRWLRLRQRLVFKRLVVADFTSDRRFEQACTALEFDFLEFRFLVCFLLVLDSFFNCWFVVDPVASGSRVT